MTEDLLGKKIADKYRIDALIKRGANGDLYQATHLLMDKPVAIKVLALRPPNDKEPAVRFFDEARAAAKISHRNILGFSDFGTDGQGYAYAVCDGLVTETLKSMILRSGQTQPEDVVLIGRQIAAGLGAIHAVGSIHGNLTAESVLITEKADGDVEAKVTDIGTPNAIARTGDVLDSTAADFAYLAPEQCAGGDMPDARGDIYALGVILYEMLTGVVPFTGVKPTDVMLKHIEEPPSPMMAFRGDLPPGIETVVLKAMSKSPEMRQQTAGELADDLARSLQGSASAAGGAAADSKGGDFWKTAAMVVVGTALLASALIYATSVRQTDPTAALQPDVNSLPVQPINPATGVEEQALAAMPGTMSDSLGNSSMPVPPDTIPGGDNYNPWGTGMPPPGAPQYTPPTGQVYTIDPNSPSQFMPPEGGVVLVPVPANTAANVRPTPSPRADTPTNSNTATPAATPTPRTSPTPVRTPAPTRSPAVSPAGKRPDPNGTES